MPKFTIVKGETGVILPAFIQDSSATNGDGLAGLTSSSGIVGCYVKRNGTGVALAVDEAVTTPGTYEAPTTAAQMRIGAVANAPSGAPLYELHAHNDLFTTEDWITIILNGATNMAPLPLEIQLINFNLNDGVRGGLTALPNAAADAAGGLPISDAGGLDLDAKIGALTFTTANQIDANALAISSDAAAADNLEAQYDGTGYVDGNAPSTQTQVSGISSSGGGAVSFDASGDNTGGAIKSISFVGSQTNTYTSTSQLDAVTHTIDDTGNEIDIVYSFGVGGSRNAVTVIYDGYLNGGNDELNVLAYDFVGVGWDQVGTISGQSGTANVSDTFELLNRHTGTGADLGDVYIRFQNTGQSNPQFNLDRLWVSAVALGQSVGYANGAIWIDTVNGTAGTENYVNGTADNPVLTWADAVTIAASIGISRFEVSAGSSITLTGSISNYLLIGSNWFLALGGQSVANAKIHGATVSGTFTGDTAILTNCIINAITGPGMTMRFCYFNEVSITNNGASEWHLNDCRSRVAGTGTVMFDYGVGVGSTGVSLRAYSGGIEIQNMGDSGTDNLSLEGNGQVAFNANCDGGTAAVRGNFRIVDNSGGNVGVIPTVPTIAQVAQGVAQGGTSNTITLAASESSTNGAYDPGLIILTAGPGAGESRLILGYNGTTKIASVDKDWRTTPTSMTSYIINSTGGLSHVNEGLAQAGASGTITLNSAASSTDDIYVGQGIFVKSGTGQDQARIVVGYNGTTKVATTHKNWNTTPDSTSGYVMIPGPIIGDYINDILTDTAEIGAAGAGLAAVPWNSSWDAEVQSEVQDALEANHLDHLLAVDYDPASKPGTSTALLNEIIGSDVGVSQFTANALELAPSGGGSAPTVIEIRTEMDDNSAKLAAIVTDTNELQTDWVNGGRLDLILDATSTQTSVDAVDSNVDAVLVDTSTTIPAQITALNDLSAANVNAEMVDALNVDTYAEPGQAAPAATASIVTKINYLYKSWRNKKDNDGTTTNFYADDGTTVDHKQTVSETSGTVTKAEIVSGP